MSRFRRRLMGLAALRQDFVRVEYIENTSNAYINTGIRSTSSVWSIDANIATTTLKNGYIIGSRGTHSARQWQAIYINKGHFATYAHMTISTYTDYDVTENTKYHLEGTIKDLTVSCDNNTFNITNDNQFRDNGNYLAIFNIAYVPNVSNAFYGRIYSFKLYNSSGTLVRDYIPMYQKSKDLYGLWDRVEGKFYTSPNGVKFIGGHQIIYDAEIEYLQSSGTQYIDLNFGFDKTDEVYTSFAILTTANDKYINSPIIWNNNNNRFGMGYHNGGYCIGYGDIGTNRTLMSPKTANDKKIHNWEYKNYVFTITDLNLTRNVSSITFGGTTKNLRLFFGLNANTPAKIASYKHIKNDQTVIDLIPVRIENIGYMYDKVSGKLFGNNGSGSFILGQDTVVYDKI